MVHSGRGGQDDRTRDGRRLVELFGELQRLPWDCRHTASHDTHSIFDELIGLDTPVAGWLSRASKYDSSHVREDEAAIRECEVELRAVVAQIEDFSPRTADEVECKEEFSSRARVLLEAVQIMLATG